MARAMKCDKCGELYDIYDIYPYDFAVGQINERSILRKLDLCPKCQVDLTLWMQNKAEFTLKEVTDDGINRE